MLRFGIPGPEIPRPRVARPGVPRRGFPRLGVLWPGKEQTWEGPGLRGPQSEDPKPGGLVSRSEGPQISWRVPRPGDPQTLRPLFNHNLQIISSEAAYGPKLVFGLVSA